MPENKRELILINTRTKEQKIYDYRDDQARDLVTRGKPIVWDEKASVLSVVMENDCA